MALDILESAGLSVLAGQVQRVIILSELGFAELFSAAFPMELKGDETSKLTQHPLENGAIISDHIIVQPRALTISMMIPNEYSILLDTLTNYLKTGNPVIILTKEGVYENMILIEKPHTESPDKMNYLNAQLKFQEAVIVADALGGSSILGTDNVTNPSNAGTATQAQSSAAASSPGGSILSAATRHLGYTGASSNYQP